MSRIRRGGQNKFLTEAEHPTFISPHTNENISKTQTKYWTPDASESGYSVFIPGRYTYPFVDLQFAFLYNGS